MIGSLLETVVTAPFHIAATAIEGVGHATEGAATVVATTVDITLEVVDTTVDTITDIVD